MSTASAVQTSWENEKKRDIGPGQKQSRP